jgi:lipid II:glycine glycyltransferase (peptidoglycan interpeptide bridge formation enzyme)
MQRFTGSAAAWDERIASLPSSHLLQTWQWAQVKAAYGWQPIPLVWDGAAAMVLKRPVLRRGFTAHLCLLYAPKGPLFDLSAADLYDQVLSDLESFARREGAILLKIDPDVVLGFGVPGEAGAHDLPDGIRFETTLQQRGWCFSESQVQFRNTVKIDLQPAENDLLAAMKQKARYNVRLAEKKGVRVRTGTLDDLGMLYRMYAETSVRDGFVIRDEAYYMTAWKAFMSHRKERIAPWAEPLVAEVDGDAVAAMFVFYFAGHAYYLYGMSREAHREKMPNYLLQWEAIKRAKDRGCTDYDLWGAPDAFSESDPMWGVYRFKEGLGGRVVRTIGAWDYPASPFWHKAYTRLVPRLLDLMRLRGKAKTRQALE